MTSIRGLARLRLSEEALVKAVALVLSVALVAMLSVFSLSMQNKPQAAKGIPVTIKMKPAVPRQLSKEAEVAIDTPLAQLDAPARAAVQDTESTEGLKEKRSNKSPDTANTNLDVSPVLIEEDAKQEPVFVPDQSALIREGTAVENLEFSVLPPTPGDDYSPELSSDELPGGDVLVLGVLVDHEGRVLDAKIVVPSRNPLNDLSFFVASKDSRYTGIDPPILPGSPRWIPVRIKYEPTTGAMLP